MNQSQIYGAAQLGRSSGPELFTTTNFAAGQTTVINRNISLQRPLGVITLRWRGRVVIGTADYTAVAAEAPQTILNNIRIFGNWKNGQQVPVDVSGASAYVMHRIYHVFGNSTFFGTTRQPDPGMPFGQVGTTFGNTGTYDLEIYYRIPMYPSLPQSAKASAIVPFLWLSEDWNDSLQVQLGFGDQTSFGTPAGGTTVTFTAFGSGAGTPTVDIGLVYYQLGGLRGQYSSAIVVRSEQTVIGGSIAAAGNNIQLIPLSKQKTTNITIKTGQILPGTSGAVSVFASLSDTVLDVTQVRVDNKYIRNTFSNLFSKEDQARLWDSILPQGYQNFSFIDGANPRAAFRADNPSVVGPGATFAVWTNVVTPGGNPAFSMIQEQIYASPNDPFWNAQPR